MKRFGLLLLPILVIAMMLGGSAFAQIPIDKATTAPILSPTIPMQTPLGSPDATLRIVNDGGGACTVGDTTSGKCVEFDDIGTLWAAIYVFDDSQEMRSCCACPITTDGLLSESVNKELTSNEFTGRGEMTRGVIKVISSFSSDPTFPELIPGLRAWFTHIQATTSTFPAPGPGGSCERRGEGAVVRYRNRIGRFEPLPDLNSAIWGPCVPMGSRLAAATATAPARQKTTTSSLST